MQFNRGETHILRFRQMHPSTAPAAPKGRPQVMRFAGFELNLDTRELLRDGARVPTEPKVFDLIVTLIENHDRAVSRGELLERLWPDAMVSDCALSRCVYQARQALQTGAGDSLIETVPRHGYRFNAVPESGVGPKARRRWPRPWMLALAAMLVLAILATWLHWSRDPDTRLPPARVGVLPFESGGQAGGGTGESINDAILSLELYGLTETGEVISTPIGKYDLRKLASTDMVELPAVSHGGTVNQSVYRVRQVRSFSASWRRHHQDIKFPSSLHQAPQRPVIHVSKCMNGDDEELA